MSSVARTTPFILPWPTRESPAALLEFASAGEWLAFLESRSLSPIVPHIVSAKYRRAQRLYALSWLDFDLIKAGELAALTALELALKDRYAGLMRKDRPMIADLLRYLVEKDGLSESKLPFTQRYGGSAADMLYENVAARASRKQHDGAAPTTLAGIRNGLAHGDPFDGLPWSGLLELVRDLIEYAYRDMIASAPKGFLANHLSLVE
ncbi:hypothetical protein [Rhizobium leguminosarum]